MGNRKPRRGDGCRARDPCIPGSPGPRVPGSRGAPAPHAGDHAHLCADASSSVFSPPNPLPRRTCAQGSPAQAGPAPEVTRGAGPGSGVPSGVVSANSGRGSPRVHGPGFRLPLSARGRARVARRLLWVEVLSVKRFLPDVALYLLWRAVAPNSVSVRTGAASSCEGALGGLGRHRVRRPRRCGHRGLSCSRACREEGGVSLGPAPWRGLPSVEGPSHDTSGKEITLFNASRFPGRYALAEKTCPQLRSTKLIVLK